ncbi:LysE family translocator [Verminephrobacter eiseniae]|uniref:LysE family translocator n=1 Tax=Verminephrobacter eiseniae TaxID=364317 RepID=UPI00223818A9|nr:LysE family translocator [Verminephrobacter eiseniae]MCW5236807.1 LysE family translocator [Verminephrobacter eiseniae]
MERFSMMGYVAVVSMMVLTPGPNIAIILQSVVTRSARSGFGNLFGIVGGFYFHALCSTVGLTLLLKQSPTMYAVVKTLGACYLVYLGINSLVQAARTRRMPAAQPANTAANMRPTHGAVLEGFITNVLNPKVGLFYLAIFPQFIGPQDSVPLRSLLLVTIHALFAFGWYSILILSFERYRSRLGGASMVMLARAVIGVVLVGLGLRVLLS